MKQFAPLLIVFLFIGYTTTYAQEWKYDIEEAKTLADKNNQNIVLFFTGSDWCPPCIKLEKKVFSQKVFKDFARENFIWVKADFPKRKKNTLSEEQRLKNEALADKYNKKWVFPVILVLNKKGGVLGATGYRRGMSADDYISLLTSFNSF